MNIVQEYGVESAVQRYNMTKGTGIQKVSDHVGEVITVKAFVIFDDTRVQDGKEITSTVVSIMTDDGDILASSGYSRGSFADIVACFGATNLPRLAIESRKTNGGRTFCYFTPQE